MTPDEIVQQHFENAMAFAKRLAADRGLDRAEAMSAANVALVRASRSFSLDHMREADAWKWLSFKIKAAITDLVVRKHNHFGDTRKLQGEELPSFGELSVFADKNDFVDKSDRPVQNEIMDRVGLQKCADAVPCSVWLVLSIVRHDWQNIEGVGRSATEGGRAEWWFAPDGIRNVRRLATERLRAAAEKQKKVLELICERLRRMEARR